VYLHVHGTQWITAHFHYVMAVSVTTAIIGGTYYLWPKMTGKMYSETLGRLGFILFFAGVNLTFGPWLYLGYKGMPRRYFDYSQFPQFEGIQRFITFGSYIIFLGALVVLISWIHSLVKGEKAPENPWGSKSHQTCKGC